MNRNLRVTALHVATLPQSYVSIQDLRADWTPTRRAAPNKCRSTFQAH